MPSCPLKFAMFDKCILQFESILVKNLMKLKKKILMKIIKIIFYFLFWSGKFKFF